MKQRPPPEHRRRASIVQGYVVGTLSAVEPAIWRAQATGPRAPSYSAEGWTSPVKSGHVGASRRTL